MTLTSQERAAIKKYRLERASQTLVEIHDNYKLGHWNLVANRLYYAVFYAGSALLVDKQITVSSHAGFVRMINLHFIKTGEIDLKYSKIIGDLFHMRQTGDYDDIYDLTETDITPYLEPVEKFVSFVLNRLTDSQ